MRPSIIEKLSLHLEDQMNSECKVVYLLCELRKLIDRQRTPLHLQMCMDWALHVDLSGSGAQNFLKRLDKYVEEYLVNPEIFDEQIFSELMFIGSFRKELRDFLISNKLCSKICDDDTEWDTFIHSYAGVIEDGALEYKAVGLNQIFAIVFNKGDLMAPADLPFALEWEILLKDSRKIILSTQRDSRNGINMQIDVLLDVN